LDGVGVVSTPDGFVNDDHMYAIRTWQTGIGSFAMGPDEEFLFIMIEGKNVHDGTVTKFYFRSPLSSTRFIVESILMATEE
jgi:hypothetical protein